uniref:Leucine-rich repeats and immunoglobulin-like domains protein 3 n=3 Tax=Cacopsylla melanoneura TaxID=428564 RepID=A0A8D8UUS9_9HEMI
MALVWLHHFNRMTSHLSPLSLLATLFLLTALIQGGSAQCPWEDEPETELQSTCICSYNTANELSIQCNDLTNYPLFKATLNKYVSKVPLDLLYINNSAIRSINENTFNGVLIKNLQLSHCRINSITPNAFRHLDFTLKHLNLQENELEQIPAEAFRHLKNLTLIDLSKNKIGKIPDDAFSTLNNLVTLKLSDNNLTLYKNSFRGLELSLKNLNLKNTKLKSVPECIKGLKSLTFLDLAQNLLTQLPGNNMGIFKNLNSLTALNLERNILQELNENAFLGVEDTLSSLSLLNNLLTEFPTKAISTLRELRVLDIGFNLITVLPGTAFSGNPSLTLLALDGNPMSTIPFSSLRHLNTTLRGLSLGGHFLQCDCKLRWIVDWIKQGDLQVTSRERNPQFCASPTELREKSFYRIDAKELTCESESEPVLSESVGVGTVQAQDIDLDTPPSNGPDVPLEVAYIEPPTRPPPSTTTQRVRTTPTTTTTTTEPPSPPTEPPTTTTRRPSTTLPPVTTTKFVPTTKRGNMLTRPTTSWTTQRPPLVLGSGYPRTTPAQEVLVKSAHRHDNSVVIQWDSQTSNILGFRVVYRLFGDKTFKQGPPLEASEREFKIKNVPPQECIVVCVISLEDINVTPDTVPYPQCREVRTTNSPTNHMDKITIAASAAICGTVLIAVIIFIAASRRRSRKLDTLQAHHNGKVGIPVCCPTSSPGPLSSLATLNAYNTHKDWDQMSMYSNRSRMYHIERPELRQSRQSLAAASDRMSRMNYQTGPAGTGTTPSNVPTGARRQRTRSRTRDGGSSRPGSRYSISGSTHTLNQYCDTSDNWTDHDMDIYMSRNPTARNGMPL